MLDKYVYLRCTLGYLDLVLICGYGYEILMHYTHFHLYWRLTADTNFVTLQ